MVRIIHWEVVLTMLLVATVAARQISPLDNTYFGNIGILVYNGSKLDKKLGCTKSCFLFSFFFVFSFFFFSAGTKSKPFQSVSMQLTTDRACLRPKIQLYESRELRWSVTPRDAGLSLSSFILCESKAIPWWDQRYHFRRHDTPYRIWNCVSRAGDRVQRSKYQPQYTTHLL